MRIGIIAPPWLPVPPRRYGGTENMIDGLARALAAQGHAVVLTSTGGDCPVPTVAIKVGNYDQMGSATIEAPYAIQAYDELVGNAQVDIIHDHTQVGFLIADTRGLPVITTNHNLFDAERQLIYREASRRGVGVVAISRSHAATAGVPIAGVVHNGVDVDNIPVGKGDGGYACVLSRFAAGKGIREAILIAKSAGIPVKIAAKTPQHPRERQYFEDEIRPLIDGKDVDHVLELDARGKYELLGGAVALINPIQWAEPFGLSMVESMACGTPVLTTWRGAAPEVVTHGQTGWLRAHWSQMGSDLENVGDTIDRATCRQVAEERFGIARMASAYLELYAAQRGEAINGHELRERGRSGALQASR